MLLNSEKGLNTASGGPFQGPWYGFRAVLAIGKLRLLRRRRTAAKEGSLILGDPRRSCPTEVGGQYFVTHGRKIAVIGLGYVGLPVAAAFARAGVPVIGFDIDQRRIAELRAFHDRTHEVEAADLRHPSLSFTHDVRIWPRRIFHRHRADAD
jgi:hypothetical protein